MGSNPYEEIQFFPRMFTVHGYHRTAATMKVFARTPQEAIEKAKNGDFLSVVTEPDGQLFKPKWTAEPSP